MTTLTKNQKRFFMALSMISFIVACFYPAYFTQSGGAHNGFMCLIVGWLGLLELYVSWLANLTYLAALAQFFGEKYKSAFVLSLVSLALGLSFLRHDSIVKDEGGNQSLITGYGAGFYLWLLSFALLAGFAGWIQLKGARSQSS